MSVIVLLYNVTEDYIAMYIVLKPKKLAPSAIASTKNAEATILCTTPC